MRDAGDIAGGAPNGTAYLLGFTLDETVGVDVALCETAIHASDRVLSRG